MELRLNKEIVAIITLKIPLSGDYNRAADIVRFALRSLFIDLNDQITAF